MPIDTLDDLAKLTLKLCGSPSSSRSKTTESAVTENYSALLREILALIEHNQPSLVPEITKLIDKYGYGEREDER